MANNSQFLNEHLNDAKSQQHSKDKTTSFLKDKYMHNDHKSIISGMMG